MVEPLVSIIVPLFNGERFIVEAIESALSQSYKNIEIIIVDDGSTDSSLSLVKDKYKHLSAVRMFQHPDGQNHGVSKTRRLGIDMADGEFIAFLDADDLFVADKVQRQIDAFKSNTNVNLVHSRVQFLRNDRTAPGFYNEFRMFDRDRIYNFLETKFLDSNPICNSTVMVRSSVIKKINNSFPQLFQYEDWINWILVSEFGRFYYLDSALAMYRFYEGSATSFMLKNELRQNYAKLEMLFILLNRLKSLKTIKRVYGDLYRMIQKTANNYKPSSKQKLGLFSFYMFASAKSLLEMVLRKK